MHQQQMVHHYCTKYEYNQPILFWDITTHSVWKSSHNYSNLAQSPMVFYKHDQHMVPDKCTEYEQKDHIFSEISQQTLKMYEKITITRGLGCFHCHKRSPDDTSWDTTIQAEYPPPPSQVPGFIQPHVGM